MLFITAPPSVHGIGAYKKVCIAANREQACLKWQRKTFRMDKTASYMIGDKLLDTEAGHRFGVTSILVGTGYGAELHKEQQEKR